MVNHQLYLDRAGCNSVERDNYEETYLSPTIMEIYAIVRNFSYYHESNTLYLTCQVKEKFVFTDDRHPAYNNFKAVRKNEILSLKQILPDLENFKSIVPFISEDLLAITISNWEKAQNCKSSPKFIFNSLRKCAILEENSFTNTAFTTPPQLLSADQVVSEKLALPLN